MSMLSAMGFSNPEDARSDQKDPAEGDGAGKPHRRSRENASRRGDSGTCKALFILSAICHCEIQLAVQDKSPTGAQNFQYAIKIWLRGAGDGINRFRPSSSSPMVMQAGTLRAATRNSASKIHIDDFSWRPSGESKLNVEA
jgi:hypothetical protein